MNRNWIWLPVLAFPLLLGGCGNAPPTKDAAESTPAASEESITFSDTATYYPRQITFDIEGITDPVVNAEIKASLKDALEGIVNEDQEQFNRAFTTAELAKANEYGFKTGGGIIFTGVDYISEQSGGRVVMNVNYTRVSPEGGETADSPNYWFMQSKEGKWGLVTID